MSSLQMIVSRCLTLPSISLLILTLIIVVDEGPMHPAVSIVSWMDYVNEFVAGTRAMALILPKDALGNTIPSTNAELSSYIFDVSESFVNNSAANSLTVTCLGWNNHGYLQIEFIASSAGDLLLHVQRRNETLRGSPLPFVVHPGPIHVSKCVGKWKYDTNIAQYQSQMEMFIYQLDIYGNLVSDLYSFDAEIVEKSTKLSMPVPDLNFRVSSPGVQLLSFTALEPGNFLLTVYDAKHNTSISNTPYEFIVSIDNCDGSKSIINGSGLNITVAGQEARFSVHLIDAYQYPCPVEMRMLQVQIAWMTDSYMVLPKIYPLEELNGSRSVQHLTHNAVSPVEDFLSPSVDHRNSSIGTEPVVAHAYGVLYTPEKSGLYGILVLCGNIPLTGGQVLKKEVKSGEVNMSLSSVVKYEPKVQKLVRNEVIIQVMDSFYNPVLSQQSKLKVEIGSINHSDFVTWMFVDNNNGSYTGQYQINDTGTFELCATFNGNKFLPCPFGVNVYNSDYFPKAHDDSISVWEDESISFSVLENDYFAGENATVIGFSTPLSGSVLQSGLLFRYTPYKGFYGNDSFSYTICDLNGNSATASVFIAVLSIPPQFFSLPTSLKGSEDVVCPKFGGFHGIEIVYPDSLENVSVTLSANSGTVSLSPMMMQFWEPIWSGLSVRRDGEEAKALSLSGHVEVLNMVLQSMQYLGDENFYGEDTIKVSARNKNGVTDLNVTIFIEPVNDPPFIIIPEHIILEENEGGGSVIYEKTNRFEIGDPDLLHFPGNKSSFLIIFSMEVTSGILEAILPVELVNTTELKLKNSYQWQPLQTFVTISDHLVVKARGLRFQATVDDCNNILKQLIYHDTEYAAILTIVINDMGNYGCFPGCAENISKPLLAEVNINLIKRKPLNSGATHALGFMIILEFLGVVSLGSLLLFYTCRCAISLMNEQRKPDSEKDAAFGNRISGEDKGKVAEKGSVAAGELQSRERPNLRQRSCHQSGHGAFTADGYRSWRGDAKLLPSLSIERSRSAKM
ncbi:protein GAMETE EXPRESSED 2 isoform X1 [Beta vulgaris subsp. vulgaris]|uniref:protein GAMETE EXPRESSED 2 isoform X1 n=2 Tax=Beta vulgaris subsp. vulgaris TaxID=3555 RepID=UPI0020371789|nr:protein GAMETE EXPRESSED 2 isoform X1 [Beta vulgaris subsp. vulgaris]